jgi:hypothetical protein
MILRTSWEHPIAPVLYGVTRMVSRDATPTGHAHAGPARLVQNCHFRDAIRRSWLVMYLVEPSIDGAILATCDG